MSTATAPQPPDTWRAAAWLDGQPGVTAAISDALLSGGRALGPASELAFMRRLPSTKKAIRDRLDQGGVLDKLAESLSKSLTELQATKAASVEELHDKFVADGKGFTLKLGGLKVFYGGLEPLIGTPSPHAAEVEQTMQREHCVAGFHDAIRHAQQEGDDDLDNRVALRRQPYWGCRRL